MPPLDKTALPIVGQPKPVPMSHSLCDTCSFGFCTITKALGGNQSETRCTHPARPGTIAAQVIECDGHKVGEFNPVGTFLEEIEKALKTKGGGEMDLDAILDDLEAESDEIEAAQTNPTDEDA